MEEEVPALAAALAALAQDSRLRVFRLLVTAGPAGLPAGQIADELAIPPNTLSFHLSHLKNAGLVTVRRLGRQMIYSADYSRMQAVVDALTESCCSRHHEAREPIMNSDEIRDLVRTSYGAVARGGGSSGCTPVSTSGGSCCGGGAAPDADTMARTMGYGTDDLAAVGEGANLGLGCGNPQAIAALRPREVVVDLGSGAGFDCFLAARQVGEGGRVIGVDMTPEMLTRARDNAARLGLGNVEFRLGEIEALPVADATADVIISNCVVNLSPDKPAVLRDAFRVLKPGGRLAVSDVVLLKPLPAELAASKELYSGCVGGAATVDELAGWLAEAGFTAIHIEPKPESRELIREWGPGLGVEEYVVSASIEARKP